MNDVNVLIHTASPSNITKIESYEELLSINTSIFQAVNTQGIRRIIYISTGEIYGDLPKEEDQEILDFDLSFRRNWYPAAKLAGEQSLNIFPPEVATSVRLFHTFGPGVKEDDGRSFADFLWAGVRGENIVLRSNGLQERTFLYLSDAVDGIFLILGEAKNQHPIINLGSEEKLTILSFAEMVSKKTNTSLKFEFDQQFQHSPNMSLLPDTTKLRNLGWSEKYSLSFAIDKTLAWIKNSSLRESVK